MEKQNLKMNLKTIYWKEYKCYTHTKKKKAGEQYFLINLYLYFS